MLGKIEGRRRGQQRLRRLDGIIHSMDLSLGKLWELAGLGLLLIGKDSDAGRDCGQEEKETTENEMVGWHH